MPKPVTRELAEHLRFHYLDGGVTPVAMGHETLWRFMPWTVVVQVVGGSFEIVLANGDRIRGGPDDCMLAPDLRHLPRTD